MAIEVPLAIPRFKYRTFWKKEKETPRVSLEKKEKEKEKRLLLFFRNASNN